MNSTQSLPSPTQPGNSTKQNAQSNSNSGAANLAKRLSSELMSLMMSPIPGCSAFPNDDDLSHWSGRIEGATETYFEGQTYEITLEFGPSYPLKAPIVRFVGVCFHPNFDLHGNICLDILKESWSPLLSVSTILISIQSLLGEPNNNSPLNCDAAELWDNPIAYKKELLKHYKPIQE